MRRANLGADAANPLSDCWGKTNPEPQVRGPMPAGCHLREAAGIMGVRRDLAPLGWTVSTREATPRHGWSRGNSILQVEARAGREAALCGIGTAGANCGMPPARITDRGQ